MSQNSDIRSDMMDRELRSDAGVTLVEMMVVIVIIGLITAIVVINVLPSQDKARVEKASADVATLQQALELYRLEYAHYPTVEQGLDALINPTDPAGNKRASFIRSLPQDPWNHPYQYVVPGERGAYDLYSLGADGRVGGEGLDADIGKAQ